MGQEQTKSAKKNLISNLFAIGYGSIVLVSILTCCVLLFLITDVSQLVMGMQDEEIAIKESFRMAQAAREQYLHITRWILEKDPTFLQSNTKWMSELERGLFILKPFVPASDQYRLLSIDKNSGKLDDIFKKSLSMNVDADNPGAIPAQMKEADHLAMEIIDHADHIASLVEQSMAGAHTSASSKSSIAILVAFLGITIIIVLSVFFITRLRSIVLRPLKRLADVAHNLGKGEFQHRTGLKGEGELQAVALAFDTMAEELVKREQQLISNERMAVIGQLAAGVAHEINNPIGIIRGYLKTLSPSSSREDVEEALSVIDEEALACQRIAEDLVSFSRTGQIKANLIEIKDLVETTVRRFREHPEASRVSLKVELEPCSICADGQRIRQVILNLLLNGAQVSPENSEMKIEGRILTTDAYQISIWDQGPGIPAEDRSKVFEPFFSKRKGGSGLGLAVCQGIVQAHGGTISFGNPDDGSKESRGTRVQVILPLKGASDATT